MKKLLTLALLLGASTSAWPQPPTLAFLHAHIHPVLKAGTPVTETLTDGTLLVSNGKILAVGQSLAPPAGALKLDCHGQDIFPSLIDPDSTLGLSEIEAVRGGEDYQEVGDLNADRRADLAVNPDSDLLPPAMSQGILACGIAPLHGLIAGRGAVMDLHGWTREDMTVKAPSHLIVDFPSVALDRSPDTKKPLEEQSRARSERLDRLTEIFENARAYGKARKLDKVPYDTVWEAMQPYTRGEQPVFIRADSYDQIVAALQWAQRERVAIALVGGYDASQLLDQLSLAKVPVIFTHMFETVHRELDSYDMLYRTPSLLAARGISVSISTGGGNANVRWLREMAAVAMANGLSPWRALAAITLEPARVLGVQDHLGSLEPGKDATFFLCNGDILDGRTVVSRAWIRGQELDLNDRQKQLYQRYRARP